MVEGGPTALHRLARCEMRRVRTKTEVRPKANKLCRSAAKLGLLGSSRSCGGHAAAHRGQVSGGKA
jgi:hypothetical protein